MRPRRRSVRVMLRQEVIWELLDQLNISQNELARRCGISRGYMSQLMPGGTQSVAPAAAAVDGGAGGE